MIDLWFEDIRKGLGEEGFVLIDVREEEEFASGHIPGSVSMPLSRFDPADLARFTGQRVVFSCAAGVRSMHAIHAARAAGLELNEHYAGGISDWYQSGGQIVRG